MVCSRTNWAAGVIAPWWLGMALAVSISADAGQEASFGASLAPLPWFPAAQPSELVPDEAAAQPSGPASGFGGFSGEARKILEEASLSIGSGEDFHISRHVPAYLQIHGIEPPQRVKVLIIIKLVSHKPSLQAQQQL